MGALWRTKRREVLAGGAILLLLLLALFYAAPERRTPMQEPDIGTLRMAEVLAAHPSYARLTALRAEERTLTLLLRDLPPLPEITPPATDPQPFEDSVWQKNAQTVLSARVELERAQKTLTESVRAATEADYEARRKAIDDDYLNAILNINLKIDNQRAMHGPKVSEEELARERANWEAERDMLKHERAARQMELYRQWQEEIRARVAAQINPRGGVDAADAGDAGSTEGRGTAYAAGGRGAQHQRDGTCSGGAGRQGASNAAGGTSRLRACGGGCPCR